MTKTKDTVQMLNCDRFKNNIGCINSLLTSDYYDYKILFADTSCFLIIVTLRIFHLLFFNPEYAKDVILELAGHFKGKFNSEINILFYLKSVG
jgi:hypothetical protein